MNTIQELPKGIIMLLHSGFAKITEDECIESLPLSWKGIPRKVVEITYSEPIDLSKLYDLNFNQYAFEHRRLFDKEVNPLLSKHPEFKIIYYGIAPIPLAIDFGQMFHNYRDIEVYQKHHKSKKWYQTYESEINDINPLRISGQPEREQKGISAALIRLNVSHFINSDDTYEILPNAAEIDISLEKPDEDAISNQHIMSEILGKVKDVLDELSENKSSLDLINLFAAIPCGLSFLIGTIISPNIHPYIQTYQYSRTQEPKYKKALLIKAPIILERQVTYEDREKAKELRELCNRELTSKIGPYCISNERMSTNRKWHEGILSSNSSLPLNCTFWNNLPALYQSSLRNDSIDFDKRDINDGFKWVMDKWFIDDSFFISVGRRLKEEKDLLKAIRLFLFHESLHYGKHKLTESTSRNIGSFPKVLETADYQSDVYAVINEFGFAQAHNPQMGDPRQFFIDTIRVATETMWSFDDNGAQLEEIQIRRLNRYLIWYWLLAKIEANGNSLENIIELLSNKPVIELNGLITKENNNRFFFVLEKSKQRHLEVAIFHNNEVSRDGSASSMSLEDLVDGVKQMNGEKILEVMRSFVV